VGRRPPIKGDKSTAAAPLQRAVRQVEPTAISIIPRKQEPKLTPSSIADRSLFRHSSKRNHFIGRFVIKACGLVDRIFIESSFPSLVLLIGTPLLDIAFCRRRAGQSRLPSFITRAVNRALITLPIPI